MAEDKKCASCYRIIDVKTSYVMDTRTAICMKCYLNDRHKKRATNLDELFWGGT